MKRKNEIGTAEAKMNAAKDELLNYVEGRKAISADEYRRLVTKVKKAEAGFLRASSKLGR